MPAIELAAPGHVRVSVDDRADGAPVDVERDVCEEIREHGAKVYVMVSAQADASLERCDLAPTVRQLRFQKKRA